MVSGTGFMENALGQIILILADAEYTQRFSLFTSQTAPTHAMVNI